MALEKIARTACKETAAFDWGIKNLLTIAKSDGTMETIDNPRWLKRRLDELARLQRIVSKEELKSKSLIDLSENDPIPKEVK